MSLHDKKVKAWIKKYGGLSLEAQTKINKLVAQLEKNQPLTDDSMQKNLKTKVSQNAKMIREYNGQKHEVTALDKGFEYRGKVYNSLSSIANEITGTRWNGKKFFGVCKWKNKFDAQYIQENHPKKV